MGNFYARCLGTEDGILQDQLGADLSRRRKAGRFRSTKNVIDIDLLVSKSPDGGKDVFLRFEQQKTGNADRASTAKAQNDIALDNLKAAHSGGPKVRMEIDGQVDITDQFDLGSIERAEKITVGPAGKGFDESLDISAPDLERLIRELLRGATTEKSS